MKETIKQLKSKEKLLVEKCEEEEAVSKESLNIISKLKNEVANLKKQSVLSKTYEEQVESLEKKIELQEQSIEEKEQKIILLERNNQKLTMEIGSSEIRVKQANEEHIKIANEMSTMKLKIQESNDEISNLKKINENSNKKYVSLEQQNKTLAEEIKKLNENKREYLDEIQKLKNSFSVKMQDLNSDILKRTNTYEKEISQSKDTIKILQLDIEKKQLKLEEY